MLDGFFISGSVLASACHEANLYGTDAPETISAGLINAADCRNSAPAQAELRQTSRETHVRML
jgi:hypothetical protein